jgi:hypothetical protein
MSTSSNPIIATRKNDQLAEQLETNPLYGIYQGEVTRTDDTSRTGTIQVFIAALAKDKTDPAGYRECTWVSPFAGSTPVAAIPVNPDVERYEQTQKSYGMWMVPPDVGNIVLVAFGDGKKKHPYIIGCVFPDRFNHMVPGMPGALTYGEGKLQVPVAEKNKKEARIDHNSNEVRRPIAPYLAEGIVTQGLINDPLRGAGSAGARRESPSQVFGILTPGPFKPGSSSTTTPLNAHRMGGHQFIMDDNPGSSMIRFRTGGGTQLMLDDTTGSIYMINKSGTGWFEIDRLGNINFYGQGSMNIRSKGNLNLRADKNINIEAGNDVNIKAAGDNIGEEYLGTNPANITGGPPLGTGGAIRLDAAADIQQFAALNYGVTAAGGDVNVNAAGNMAFTSSGFWGISLGATVGPIAMEAKASGISVFGSAGIGLASSSTVGIVGTRINLNSGPGFQSVAWPAIGPGPIGLNEHKDQPAAAPEFDLDAALKGENAIKNNGNRSGKQDTIKSIVTCLVTAEPYSGHYQGDIILKEDPTAQGADETVTEDLPPGASTSDGKPDDAQTPGGSTAGDGYVDSNGNTVSQSSTSPSVASRARTAVASATTRTQGATGSATRALNDAASRASAELANLQNSIPTYADVGNAVNDFSNALEKKISEVLGLGTFVAAIRAQLPTFRFPTTNALQQQVLAGIKLLKEKEAQLRQFSLDKFGLPIDLNLPAIQAMQNQINGVMAQARDGLDAVNRLKELGIEVVNDAGSLIYRDSLGNTLVDFRNGVGPVASSLAIQSEMARTYNNIKNSIGVPLNNNQAQALSAFAKDIGEENFRNSNVLRALNEGKYNEVPRLMAQWSLGPTIGSNVPTPTNQLVYRQDFNDKRYFQGQVFQSPDNLNIAPPNGTADGELSPRQMGDLIKSRREEFNATNYVGPTEYFAGPRR